MRDGKGVPTIRDSCWSLSPDVPRPNKCALQTFGQHKQSFWIDSAKEGCGKDVAGNGNKHVKGTINHQLQKFTPVELVP